MNNCLKLFLFIAFILVIARCSVDEHGVPPPVVTQEIFLEEGWNLWSTYINTSDSLIVIMDSILDHVICLTEDSNNIYAPDLGLNTIGKHKIGRAYQISVDSDQTLYITGLKANPRSHPIVLEEGWSFLGYLLDEELELEIAFESIMQSVIFIKNDEGGFFWHEFEINQIGNLKPGEGYQIFMNNRVILFYPEIDSE